MYNMEEQLLTFYVISYVYVYVYLLCYFIQKQLFLAQLSHDR